MSSGTCGSCYKNKTALRCSSCEELSCKLCSYFVDEYEHEYISYFSKDLLDKIFCPSCYNEKVAEQIDKYNEVLSLAKQVNVYGKDQGSETGVIRRIEKPVKVEDCDDEKTALMILAFQAALKGYDTIIGVDVVATKQSKGGTYKTHTWAGTAFPVDPKIKK